MLYEGNKMRIQLFKMILLLFMISLLGCNDANNKNVNFTKGMLSNLSSTKKIISKLEASDVSSIKSKPMELLFAYYTANSNTQDGKLRWYISATRGSLAGYIFSLGDIETINGVEKVSWREVSKSASSVNLESEKVFIGNIADNLTYRFQDWGLGVEKKHESIQEDIELIRNNNVNVKWWFFQAPNGSWFIIDKANHIYKFETKNGEYDWQQIDTSTFSMEFYIEGGLKKIRVLPSSVIPTITGTPKTSTNTYDTYQFSPTASDVNNDTLTYSIQNQPSWAEFNTTTGLLEGNPNLSDGGSYSNIIISVTDGSKTASLAAFDIEVNPAINIAHKFGKAIQGKTYGVSIASRAIDGNLSTSNHTQCNAIDNWFQVELPNPTKMAKLVIYNQIGQQARLNKAKVYLSNSSYTGEINSSNEIETLNSDTIQTFSYATMREGRYLLIKADGANCLHMPELEVYGETPVVPVWKSTNSTLGLKTHAPVGAVVGKVEALDYQFDVLSYSIVGDVPFTIDSQGSIRVVQVINHNTTQKYTFQIEASDGVNTVNTDVSVKLLNGNAVKQERWNGISGESVNDFLTHAHYQDAPDETKIVSGLDMNTNLTDNFGQKSTTLFNPLESGSYIFAIVGDDGTELRLNGKKIADRTSWTSYQNWAVAGKSEAIYLEAGNIYQMEAFLKEGGGGEHYSVGFQKVGESDFQLIPENQLFLEVLNSENVKPVFVDENVTVNIDKWHNKTEAILSKKAIDMQSDTLTYTLENTTLFSIDEQGDIHVSSTLNSGTETFVVKVSDGTSIIQKTITVTVLDVVIPPKSERVMDSSPALNGYLPNNYNDGSSIISIVINGNSYTPRIEGGKWYIDANSISPALTPNSYDIKVLVDGNEILYTNYFSVDGLLVKSVSKIMVVPDIANVTVTVQSYIQTALLKDEKVKGTSVSLRVEANGTVVLENKSYREFSSLIGEYNDTNTGEKVLVRLQFNQHILPYSTNTLESFTNVTEMTIYHTANMFDGDLAFGGEVCNENTDTSGTHYCVPTSSENQETYSTRSTGNNEQKVYSTLWATYNHLYNSIDGFNSLKAWVEQGLYKGADLSSDYQSSAYYITSSGQTASDYLNEKFFGIVQPNKSANMRSMRYRYAAEGMAGVPSSRPLTYRGVVGSWASLWEGSIRADSLSAYEYVQHEVFHSFSYGHTSGMTYGWSHGLRQVINTFYMIGQNPVVEAPKYLFTSKLLADNKIQLTLHKTAEATDDEMQFELFSATKLLNDDVSISRTENDEDNQVTIAYKPNTLNRVFVRVYGSDSKELMSQLFEF